MHTYTHIYIGMHAEDSSCQLPTRLNTFRYQQLLLWQCIFRKQSEVDRDIF